MGMWVDWLGATPAEEKRCETRATPPVSLDYSLVLSPFDSQVAVR
jgi:hypothetical protein